MYDYLFLFALGETLFSEEQSILFRDVEVAPTLRSDGLILEQKRIKNIAVVTDFAIADQSKIDWRMWGVLMKGLYPPALEIQGGQGAECTHKCGKGVQGERGKSGEEHGRGGRGRGNN